MWWGSQCQSGVFLHNRGLLYLFTFIVEIYEALRWGGSEPPKLFLGLEIYADGPQKVGVIFVLSQCLVIRVLQQTSYVNLTYVVTLESKAMGVVVFFFLFRVATDDETRPRKEGEDGDLG